MKQRKIKELTINHYEQGTVVSYTPSRTEEYAPVLAQAEAHQDLRFHATVNNVETPIVFPWESVISVNATYETAEVTAPHDAICGGEAVNPLVLTLITPTDTCYVSEGGQVGFAADIEVGGEPGRVWQYGNGTLEFGFVESITLFGIPLESYPDFDESLVSTTAEIVLENGVATMTATFTYGEYTDTAVLTANHECVISGG